MSIFDIFFGFFKKRDKDINFILKRLSSLKQKELDGKYTFKDKAERDTLYKNLSKMLFNAIKTKNYSIIEKIFSKGFIVFDELVDQSGYNIVEYTLFNAEDDMFMDLYNTYYDIIIVYFSNIPELFLIAMHKKNWKIVKFFLENTDLSDSLRKENFADCLFNAIQTNQKDIINIIVKNFANMIDTRNIEASIIYLISHAQKNELNLILSYDEISSKFGKDSVEKLLVFSVINQNIDALETIITNKNIEKTIDELDSDIIKTILQVACNNNNMSILKVFAKNKKIKDNFGDVLRIEG